MQRKVCSDKDQGMVDYQPLNAPSSGRLVTVEPAISCYFLALGFIIGLQSEYIQARVARIHNYTLPNNAGNGTCLTNKSSEEYILQQEIQAESSRWLMYCTVANLLPSLFMIVIIGALSDSVGRRFSILLPLFGQLQTLCMWIATVLFDLPLEYLIGAMFLQGLTGGPGLFIASCFTYISDVTSHKSRTLRIVIGECVLMSSSGIAQIFAGYVLDKYNFVIAFAVAAAISLAAIIYMSLPCLSPETVDRVVDNSPRSFKSRLVASLRGIKNITVNTSSQYRIAFYLIMFMVFTFSISATGALLLPIHFLDEPFCFSYLLSGYYTTTLIFTPGIGLLLSALILKRFMDDYCLLHLGVMSCMAFLIASALAQTATLAFVGAGLGIFKAIFAPACRSFASKMSSAEEQGAVYGCLGFTESLGMFLCSLILNNIYSATVDSMPTFVFWLCAGSCSLPLLAIGYLQYKSRVKNVKTIACCSSERNVPGINECAPIN
ncbi:lysosomal proton-coupled steroid conjugate and bile acid symporter SLC46A3-like [Antedon mediterranea]|uniref:lysosomal proton-coupled steroid conjugate and bile acid symporter SLC46A3-like n=1 Tax=Antedon mediterranea TaxID=105859 RepID=UPI003AF4271A